MRGQTVTARWLNCGARTGALASLRAAGCHRTRRRPPFWRRLSSALCFSKITQLETKSSGLFALSWLRPGDSVAVQKDSRVQKPAQDSARELSESNLAAGGGMRFVLIRY